MSGFPSQSAREKSTNHFMKAFVRPIVRSTTDGSSYSGIRQAPGRPKTERVAQARQLLVLVYNTVGLRRGHHCLDEHTGEGIGTARRLCGMKTAIGRRHHCTCCSRARRFRPAGLLRLITL
nr:hypothetical protein [Phyllobacterium brassicacearum]